MELGGVTYIMTNKNNSVLYTGATSEFHTRIIQHKEQYYKNSFTSKYQCFKLVYYELHNSIEEAINREKQIKAGSRKKKVKLIESMNPEWKDLFDEIKKW